MKFVVNNFGYFFLNFPKKSPNFCHFAIFAVVAEFVGFANSNYFCVELIVANCVVREFYHYLLIHNCEKIQKSAF